tara:strand:+ start:60 stop:311 length:252 start_codon:yes stop_codon:yes gene_type:complete
MLDLTKLPILNNNHEYLEDNSDYSELYERLNYKNIEDYLIIYSYSTDFLEVITELVSFNIEFSHKACHLSDESYLLIDKTQTL